MVTKAHTRIEELLELVEQYPEKYFKFDAQGEIIEVSPKLIHGIMQQTVGFIVRPHLPEGYVVASEVAHELNGWPCRPDVSVNRQNDAEIPTVAPLLAVEIKSESNSLKDLREKARRYIQLGTKLVWLILPDKRLIEVYQPGTDDVILTIDDRLEGGNVLPGLNVPVSDVFEGF
jgi:Uma2 family endonuclease